ncbi:hypothetical protein A6S26_14795 [Nostoc sp. ATCC 43529]|nr:hypothetical protein A6S26_14795 [Nostoc sp. ATCC 43529]
MRYLNYKFLQLIQIEKPIKINFFKIKVNFYKLLYKTVFTNHTNKNKCKFFPGLEIAKIFPKVFSLMSNFVDLYINFY